MTILEEKRSPDDSRELELELSEEGIYHIKRVSVKDRVSEGDPETSDPEAVTEEVTEEEILTIIIGDNSSEQETQKEREEETDEPEENHPGEELPAEERPEKPRDPVQQGPGQDAGGNEEKPAAADPAPEDRTAPGIRITGVENAAVYGSPVIPHIHIEDSSISFPSLKYSLTGARTGQLDLQALADVRKSRNGLDIRVDGFRSAEDDVYTLSVQAADLAGNVSREEVVFSLDQEGSAFILSDATKELVEKYYTEEPEDVVLSEVNTGGVIYELALSRDGALRELKEDQDYSVEVRGGDGDWKIYTYRIFADTFREDGVYHLDITSRDQADNVNNNQIRDARIDFVVDKSGAGISEGKKTGNSDEKDPEDPASLKEQGNQNDLGEEQTASQEAQAFADHSVTETQGKDGKREEKNPVALILLLIGSLITMGAGLYLVRKKERWLH